MVTNFRCKIIKKLVKIALIFLLGVFSLPTIAYFVVKNNHVQQYILYKLTTGLSQKLDAPVSVKSANIDLFANIHLTDFCILSKQRDTIIFVPELTIKPKTFTISSKFIELNKIILNHPDIYFYIDSTRTINFQFIVNKLVRKDTTSNKAGWDLRFDEIQIRKGYFTLKNYYRSPKEKGIDFTDMELQSMDLKVQNFRNSEDGISFTIKKFSAIEKSGFKVDQFYAKVRINRENMIYNALQIKTPNSSIDADQARLNFPDYRSLSPPDLFSKVNFTLDLNKSVISTSDLAYFAPVFYKIPITSTVSGNFKGNINDLRAKNFDLAFGKSTRIKGNATINGLPDIASSFMHIDIKSLYTTPNDIQNLEIKGSKISKILLPENFKNFTYFTYRGKFTGFISDFVAFGTFSSNLGTIESDLSFKPDTADYFDFSGKVKATRFNVGKFLSRENLMGEISLNALADGRVSAKKQMQARIDGIIQSFNINKYTYQNIKVNGTLSNKKYDGKLTVTDPNINFDFEGKVNLENEIPEFNFTANLKRAKLYNLHFDRKDTASFMSCLITADFQGRNIDDVKGEVKLWNSTFRKTGKEIQVNDFLLFSKTIGNTNRIILRSDLADAELWGNYHFSSLTPSFLNLLHGYLPSFVTKYDSTISQPNNFQFDVDLKDTRQLTDYFIPGLYISKDSKLTGSYNSSENNLDFLFKVPLLQQKDRKWYDVYFNGKTNKESFSLISGCNNLKISNQLKLENFTILSDFGNDSISLAMRWNNWDSAQYKGNLKLIGVINRVPNSNFPELDLFINPSQVVLKDTLWSIRANQIKIDTSGVQISNFKLWHNDQQLEASGSISKNEKFPLIISLRNVNLEHLKTIFNPNKLEFGGIINGEAEFTNIFYNPIFHSNISIDSFSLNNEILGNTNISAVWNNASKQIAIDAISQRGKLTLFQSKGVYSTETKGLDFDVNLNKMKLSVLEPLLSGIFSDIKGTATGNLKVTGTTHDPLLNGEINAQKASFVVNYLKTRYNFTDKIPFKNNQIIFDHVTAYDDYANKAQVNGLVRIEQLKNTYVNLGIVANNFECLNTTDKDNPLYYGHGFATGTVTIEGLAPNIQMDIKATSNKNTAIFIPLGSKTELSESKFVRFIESKPVENPYEKYEIDKPATNQSDAQISTTGFKVNLSLKATPDADMQIVFDQKIGDVIKGNGSGDINMTFDGSNFYMYGKYTISQGEYLFTLQNFINKKFIVNQGSTITWNGDPLDAIVNIEAIYRVKASLYELMANSTDAEKYRKRIPIDCRLFMTDRLMNPNIKYDINLPNADQETQNIVDNYIATDEDLSYQFLSLLILNSFYVSPDKTQTASNGTDQAGGINAANAGVTGIEFLSNQLSHWLSQISNDFDIGVNYHPGDQISTQEVELALSAQLLNNRVSIYGNLDVGGNQITPTTTTTTSNIVGDFDMDVKLTDNGKLRLKVFNRSNESDYTETSPYTQGVGLFYKEDFNSFSQLMKKYYEHLFTRKKEQPKPVEESKTEKSPEEDVSENK